MSATYVRQRTRSGVTALAVRAGFELDALRLVPWLEDNVAGFTGPIGVEQFSGGQSNPTYRLTTPSQRYVLRRKPSGPLVRGAHAIEREVTVMQALGQVGFPVPRVLAQCADDDVIGSSFYVMDYLDGRIIGDGGMPGVSGPQRRAHQEAMAATLGQLHRLDPADLGLADFGRTDHYLPRHLARWTRQYRDEVAAPRNADMDFLAEWLPAHLPAERPARLVHGDYRIDNVVFRADGPSIAGVLDWELSTLGDPIADLAYNLLMYRTPSSVPWGLADRDLDRLGMIGEAPYLAAYRRAAGLEALPDLRFYIAYSFFRVAAILHGIKGRIARGNAASAEAGAMAAHLDLLAQCGRVVADGPPIGELI